MIDGGCRTSRPSETRVVGTRSWRTPLARVTMSDPNARKILIVGDVRGRLDDLYKRVARVNKTPAGPFDALFCVGPFFEGAAEDAADGDGADGDAARHAELRPYVDGTAVAPVPTYFVEGLPAGRAHCRDPDGVVAPNITFLRHPKVSVVEGLRVAVLPGRHNDMSYADASKVAAAAAAAEGEHLAEDVAALRASHFADGAGVVDLLLTSQWPRGVHAFASPGAGPPADVVAASNAGTPPAAELARDLQPRYHAAGNGGCFYAREPYRNPRGHVTRFLGLARVGNPEKQKWMHALSLVPAEVTPPAALAQHPADTTRSPYSIPTSTGAPAAAAAAAAADAAFDHGAIRWEEPKAKRARLAAQIDRRPVQGDVDKTVYVKNLSYRAAEGALAEFFGQCGEIFDLRLGRDDQGKSRGFCHVAFKTTEAAEKALELNDSNFFGRDILVQMAKTEEQRNAERDERRARERANRPPAAPPTGCWFCLSNEKDVHLVVSIAGESFMSMDKGGLVADHCQVVPVEHVPSFAALAPSAAEEVWRYLAAARRCFAAGGGGAPTLGEDGTPEPREMVVFERHLALRSKGGNHCHMNCVPVPRARAGKARKIFEQAAKRLDFEWEVVAPPESAADAQAALASIAGDGEYYCVHLPDGTMLVRKIGRGEPHWMSFGREVLGHLLGCPERTGWQNCMESVEAEAKRTEAFKTAFEKFDIMQQ